MLKLAVKVLKVVAPLAAVGGGAAGLFTNVLAGLGLPPLAVQIAAGLLAGGGLGYVLTTVGEQYVTPEWLDKALLKFKIRAGQFLYGLGVATTLGLAKYPYTKKLWNVTLEKFLITVGDWATGAVDFLWGEYKRGLAVDDNSQKKKGK